MIIVRRVVALRVGRQRVRVVRVRVRKVAPEATPEIAIRVLLRRIRPLTDRIGIAAGQGGQEGVSVKLRGTGLPLARRERLKVGGYCVNPGIGVYFRSMRSPGVNAAFYHSKSPHPTSILLGLLLTCKSAF